MGGKPSHEQTEEEKLFNVCAQRSSITVPGNKCFIFGVIGGVVATAIFVPFPKFSLWHSRRVYPMLAAGGAGILLDDYLMTEECLKFAKLNAQAGKKAEDMFKPPQRLNERTVFELGFFKITDADPLPEDTKPNDQSGKPQL